MALAPLLVVALACSAHAWGGLFNRLSDDMLARLGYGRHPYRQYPYGQVDPEEVYAEPLQGNRIDDVIEEPAHCYSAPCITGGDCCRGLLCLETDETCSEIVPAGCDYFVITLLVYNVLLLYLLMILRSYLLKRQIRDK